MSSHSTTKPATASSKTSSGKKRPQKESGNGMDEIDSLFAEKKKKQRLETEEVKSREQAEKSNSKNQAKRTKSSNGTSASSKDWVDDGLGGKYNAEGYTGRVQDGIKIFKAHLLNKSKHGNTPECPFDCKCCFI
jgi:hypothetical protein